MILGVGIIVAYGNKLPRWTYATGSRLSCSHVYSTRRILLFYFLRSWQLLLFMRPQKMASFLPVGHNHGIGICWSLYCGPSCDAHDGQSAYCYSVLAGTTCW